MSEASAKRAKRNPGYCIQSVSGERWWPHPTAFDRTATPLSTSAWDNPRKRPSVATSADGGCIASFPARSPKKINVSRWRRAPWWVGAGGWSYRLFSRAGFRGDSSATARNPLDPSMDTKSGKRLILAARTKSVGWRHHCSPPRTRHGLPRVTFRSPVARLSHPCLYPQIHASNQRNPRFVLVLSPQDGTRTRTRGVSSTSTSTVSLSTSTTDTVKCG